MYAPGKVMKSGTWSDPSFAGRTVTGRTAVIDMNQPTPLWQLDCSQMSYIRTQHTLTVLPDGNVFVSGGATQLNGFYPQAPSCRARSGRRSPSLDRDGARLKCRAVPLDRRPAPRRTGAGRGRRPTTGVPHRLSQRRDLLAAVPLQGRAAGDRVRAPTTSTAPASRSPRCPRRSIASLTLIRLGAVTHAFDQDQRYVPLTFTQGAGTLNGSPLANANLAPPGYYMLFIVNSNGVPSIAPLRPPAGRLRGHAAPDGPANLVATGGVGTAALSPGMPPATTPASSATPTCTARPHPASRPAPPTASPSRRPRAIPTTGRPAGTYYYRVIAVDGAGNVSAPLPTR